MQAAREANLPDGALPVIHISGCPSSCGTHQVGALGFHGGVKLVDKKPHPAFTLHVNGSARMGQERFGESWGVIFEERIPEFLVAVGRKVADAGLSFEEWLPAHEAELRTLAAEYLV